MVESSRDPGRPKVVLLAAPRDQFEAGPAAEFVPRNAPTMALYYLAAILRQAGYGVEAIDTAGYRAFMLDPAARVKDALAVGLSANTMTWPATLRAARAIAALPDRPFIILGGLHPTLFDEHVLEVSGADFVVRGEGEVTLPALLESIAGEGRPESWPAAGSGETGRESLMRRAAAIPGVTARVGGGAVRGPDRLPLSPAQLGYMPLPAYDLIPTGFYATIPVEASRGCRFSCGFCSIAGRRGHRAIPFDSVVARLREAVRHRARSTGGVLLFVDDCLTACPDVIRIAEFIAAEFPKAPLAIEARADDLLQPGLVGALAACTVGVVQVGIECGYKDGLRRVGKGVTLETVEEACLRLRDAGLARAVNAAYIMGFPWESAQEALDTVCFALALGRRAGYLTQFAKWAPFPGSRFTDALDLPPGVFDTLNWLMDEEVRARATPRMNPDEWKTVSEVTRLLKVLYSDVKVAG
jgi:anaerobic magnesium-protoporphyrin IX monomethyl ester cyclase